MNSFSLAQNPFTRTAFWDRQNELRTIYQYLLSKPPQCCAVIGETYFGKTTLLRHLVDARGPSGINDQDLKDSFTFVYLDCMPYIELAQMGVYASAQFWWDLYSRLWVSLHSSQEQPPLPKPGVKTDTSIDTALEIKFALEGLIRDHKRTVIFVLDNFEGVAHLPLRDSEWLRSLVQLHCAYVVASRHLLYLLYQYHPESWANPSPLWNLFSDPIYLGLIPEHEVQSFLLQAYEQARALGSCWEQKDIDFIRTMAGRHPELIRIACAQLFEHRLQSQQSLTREVEQEFLEISIQRAASPICNKLWLGLADPELWDILGVAEHPREKETRSLSPYQKVLIRIAKGYDVTEKDFLFVLEQRGLIEWRDGKWHVFAEVMRQFALTQEQVRKSVEPTVPSQAATPVDTEAPAFAYLEGKVYEYLKAHAGEVCDREEIKQAVWGDNPPTNSALQKIIERIREKIEPGADNPRFLIAVRGQGYMLRKDSSD